DVYKRQPPDREPTIVCFPGVEFQPSELHFPPGFVIRRLRARQKGRFLLNRWYFKVNSRWGLFTLWYPLNLSQVIVVQNPLRRLEQRILRKWPAISHYQNQQGGELEFHSLRQYRPGDPVRQINWKKTARGNAVYLNLFEREEFRQVLFLLHTGMAVNYRWRSDDFLDYNIALLLALSATVLNSYGQAGLIAFSNRVHQVLEPAPGLKQQQRFRKALLHIRSDSKTMPAPQMLSQLTRYIRPGSQVIWLQPLTTPAEAEHFLPVVSHWRQHARLLWISAQRISRSVVSDAILAKWQGEQQKR
ncbi:MAG: DUF58 domain-containing protein, partial [Candidatus Sumerlaeia bacterium]|nr:DUF58 domain-containing protein [Candidatus Sumerlaeia bacterium]